MANKKYGMLGLEDNNLTELGKGELKKISGGGNLGNKIAYYIGYLAGLLSK